MLYAILIATIGFAIFFAFAIMLYFIGVALYAICKGFVEEWKRSASQDRSA